MLDSQPKLTRSKVDMSIDDKAGPGVKLYHNHTNRTLPSAGDMGHLLDERVSEIGTVTLDGEVYVVRTRGGSRPSAKEYKQVVDDISKEVKRELRDYPNFYDLDFEERQFLFFMTRTRRIVAYYDWELEGGMI